jgi:redox-sensitive bicupin YhaK (pirin superfamily)
LPTEDTQEYAAFLPLQEAVVNDTDYTAGDLMVFEQKKGEISFRNMSPSPVDVIIFGGEPYTEPIVAAGPFVMNTQHEISLAYNDYYKGKYGEITYEQRNDELIG